MADLAAGGFTTNRSVTVESRRPQVAAYVGIPECGFGPGLLLLHDGNRLDADLRGLCDLFAEEGYVVLAPDADLSAAPIEDVVAMAAALRALPEQTGKTGAIGYRGGATIACRAADAAALDAVVAYDPIGLDRSEIEQTSHPTLLQAATADDPVMAETVVWIRDRLARHGVRAFGYAGATPGFAVPGRAAYDARLADIAHTRTLRLLRSKMGPDYDFAALFEAHIYHEFVTRDAQGAIDTMVAEPYVNHVPTLTGGVGREMLLRFYTHHFVDQNSADRENFPIAYTVDGNRLVIEQVARFVHDRDLDRYFPGIPPTGKRVEIPLMISVKFRGPRVCYEHIYWDQATALAQIGAIDPTGLPIAGPEQAAKVLDPTLPSNEMMTAWPSSEGKPV